MEQFSQEGISSTIWAKDIKINNQTIKGAEDHIPESDCLYLDWLDLNYQSNQKGTNVFEILEDEPIDDTNQ